MNSITSSYLVNGGKVGGDNPAERVARREIRKLGDRGGGSDGANDDVRKLQPAI